MLRIRLVHFRLALILALSPVAFRAEAEPICSPTIDSLAVCFNYLAMNPHDGSVWGADGQGDNQWLQRMESHGESVSLVHYFSNPIRGIHFLDDGTMFVSTDFDYESASPDYPDTLFRSIDGGQTFDVVKVLESACAVNMSFAHDYLNNLYVGEYGPRGLGLSNRVWKSSDRGDTWSVAFEVPAIDDIHIHRVAVDPYTQDVWVSYGHADYGLYRSQDGGQSWTFMRASLPPAVAFTETAIYWGEDDSHGVVCRFDRATAVFDTVLQVSQLGPYGGAVYDMTVGPSGQIYVPFVKYPEQTHVPSIWIGHDTEWQLLQVFVEPQTGASSITPPDRSGNMYVMYHRIREDCAIVGVPETEHPLMLRVGSNPTRGLPFIVELALPATAPATLELFDVAGRRVGRRDIGASPGPQVVSMAPDGAVRSGVYMLRLTQGRNHATLRVAVTH